LSRNEAMANSRLAPQNPLLIDQSVRHDHGRAAFEPESFSQEARRRAQ
jgi:hypothetical protein